LHGISAPGPGPGGAASSFSYTGSGRAPMASAPTAPYSPCIDNFAPRGAFAMDQAIHQEWERLRAAFDAAQTAFDARHAEVVARVERIKQNQVSGKSLLECVEAQEAAAERWVAARRALADFCKQHPDVCFPESPQTAEA